MGRNQNHFSMKFSDNNNENCILMNGEPLKGVTRINTDLIAGEERGLVVIEMLATSVIEMVAETLINADEDGAIETAGHTMYEELEELLDGEPCPSPAMLSKAFKSVIERLVYQQGVCKDD